MICECWEVCDLGIDQVDLVVTLVLDLVVTLVDLVVTLVVAVRLGIPMVVMVIIGGACCARAGLALGSRHVTVVAGANP